MKIIYDNIIFNLQKYGGISRYFSEIIGRIKRFEDTEVNIFRGFKGKLARFNNPLMNYRFSKKKCDIYHPTYYSYTVKKRKNIKTVVTVHDMGLELFLSGIKNFRNDILVKKKSIFNADYIICVSNNTKKELQEIYNIDDNLISVIYHGHPENKERQIKCRHNIIIHKPYILYVGNRAPYKNFMILPKVFRELNIDKDFDLVCFGGVKFSREELREFRKLNLEDSIKYTEGADDLLQFYYENASIFIFPSFYEGFGLPIIEAMAFGCPVIASNIASISEISDNAALLFSPQSVEELCQCVKGMINDKKMRDEYIERGKKRYKDFSWEKTASETFGVYQKLLS